MDKGIATRSTRGHPTISVPISEERYPQIVNDPKEFRRTLDECFRRMPDLFPKNFAEGYQLKDDRRSAEQDVPIRRIVLQRRPRLQRPTPRPAHIKHAVVKELVSGSRC